MNLDSFLPLFLVGLLGGTHCVGMCGGIVSALSAGASPRFSLLLAYNGGRVLSYGVAGVLAGAVGAQLLSLGAPAQQAMLRLTMYLLANLILLGMGLYLLGLPQLLLPLERAGGALWRRIQPWGRGLFPVRSAPQALLLGLLWGWLPCGLVYTALASALAAGGAGEGGWRMLAFGLGTLPNLLLAGVFLARFQALSRSRWMKRAAGGVVLGFAIIGLVHLIQMESLT